MFSQASVILLGEGEGGVGPPWTMKHLTLPYQEGLVEGPGRKDHPYPAFPG